MGTRRRRAAGRSSAAANCKAASPAMPVAQCRLGDHIDPLLLLSAKAIRLDLNGLLYLPDYVQHQIFEPLPRQLMQWQPCKLRVNDKGKGIAAPR